MNELRELGVTYVSIAWFEDERYGIGHFRLEKTGETFHEIRPASFSQVNEEIKKVIRELKKRYWLWDVSSRYGEIFKSTAYMDEKGVNTNGSSSLYGDRLLKKHENEWIEV